MEDRSKPFVKKPTNAHYMSNYEINHFIDPKKIKGEGNLAKKYKRRDKKALAITIASKALELMFDDMIENNTTVLMPHGYTNFIRIESMPDKVVKKKRQAGNYEEVDIWKSEYKMYQFVLTMKMAHKTQMAAIRIPKKKYLKLIEKVNNGKRYFEGAYKRIN